MRAMDNSNAARIRRYGAAPILIAFAWGTTLAFIEAPGDDLAPTFIGCRLLAHGQGEELYSHDVSRFDRVGQPSMARPGGRGADFPHGPSTCANAVMGVCA